MWNRQLNVSILMIVFWILLLFGIAMIGQLIASAAVLFRMHH